MECPNGCEVPLKQTQVERIFYHGSEPVVIRNLTMYVCPICGHEAMPLKSARVVESVLTKQVEPSGFFTAPLYQPA